MIHLSKFKNDTIRSSLTFMRSFSIVSTVMYRYVWGREWVSLGYLLTGKFSLPLFVLLCRMSFFLLDEFYVKKTMPHSSSGLRAFPPNRLTDKWETTTLAHGWLPHLRCIVLTSQCLFVWKFECFLLCQPQAIPVFIIIYFLIEAWVS